MEYAAVCLRNQYNYGRLLTDLFFALLMSFNRILHLFLSDEGKEHQRFLFPVVIGFGGLWANISQVEKADHIVFDGPQKEKPDTKH